MLLSEKLAEPLSDLPPVEFAFSYGSGVFPQPADKERSTIEVGEDFFDSFNPLHHV